jgi:hypothetical protein
VNDETFEPGHAFVVMAHGDSPFLADCIRSLRSQTRPSAITVTTSTPSAFVRDVARDFACGLIVNPRRDGIASDWNFALRATPARYVTLCHQDDVYLPLFLERSLGRLEPCRDATLCFTGYTQITDDGSPTRSLVSTVIHGLERATLGNQSRLSPGRLRAFLALGNPLPCSSVTFDRSRLGAFRFCDRFQSNLDWDAWLRLSRRGDIFVREPSKLVGRRRNALTATSRLIAEGVRRREDLQMFRRLWPTPIAEIVASLYRCGY